ncbi:hypothetical protein HXX76_007356 [Chlamydomonas incerta]|uniref:FAD-binding domain-containing protein n=1 Tax=Chlamydomonas incerta TaxID=51695 RepID=A0A835SY17_CHLIN|nr:hypothetical protein HXX76_007356 [Chlamydomonas incerta]|eukprot:KAG2435279.1 hypothetical protein HXX76_007356 [Chlamydomonas incerta]
MVQSQPDEHGAKIAFDELDVAIVGGGPAGLATAAALLRAKPSLRVKVFEASPAFRTQGSGVLLQTNGARALQAIHPGIMHRLTERGAITSGVYQYNDESGERLPWVGGKDPAADLRLRGWANCLVLWSDLREVLAAGLPRGVLELGCKVTHTDMGAAPEPVGEQSAGGRMAQLTILCKLPAPEGGEGQEQEEEVVVRARHVIAADGYFSRVRRTVCAGGGSDPAALAAEMPAFMGLLLWRGSITRAELEAAGVPLPACLDPALDSEALCRTHMWTTATADSPLRGPPARGLMIYPARNTAGPVGSGGSQTLVPGDERIVWNVWVTPPKPEQAGGLADGGAGPRAEDRGTQHGSSAGPEALSAAVAASSFLTRDVAALLAATPADRVTGHGLYVHPVQGFKQGAWVRDRLVLVGDAAHTAPPDGQGANLAMEDAAVLGACVRQHGLGPEAFAAWEAARQPRVASILGDHTPGATIRTPLINEAAFERVWSPADLLAEERALAQAAAGAGVAGLTQPEDFGGQGDVGRLPPDVVASLERILAGGVGVGAEAASAPEAEELAAAVVREWSADMVGRLVMAKVEGRAMAVRVPPPEGTYSVR